VLLPFLVKLKTIKFVFSIQKPMKKNRLIFYSVFGALHLFIFFFSLYMDGQKENIQFLFQLQGKIWMLKYGSLLLLLLMAANVILHYRDNRRNEREKDQLNQELNTLKAKLYDLQEGAKKTPAPENPSK
jgi:hypothetical protein